MMRNLLAGAALLIGICLLSGGAEAACGEVTIAEMNWGSAAIAAHIDKIILERGFHCKVTLVPADTVPTFTSMLTKGQPDMAPEFWINAVRGPLGQATDEGRLVLGAEILEDGAVEGWWIPKFIIDANPEIRTVEDALARPDLFPSRTDPDRGALHGCPADWSCQASTANLFRAFAADEKGFELIQPKTPEEMDAAIEEAFRTQTGWLGYYWAPTAVLGKYPMVKLSFGVTFNKAEWDSCTAVPHCPSPQRNAYPTSQAFTLVTQEFTEKADDAIGYIRLRRWSNATINNVLAWQQDNKASNGETALHFLRDHEAVWAKWVVPVIAERIKAAQ
ncbi:ABC transporter substrate-binding protein [Pseudorhizobium endolithicum]|uniref:ABC transporter substrate-binding protein n=2 Tax=Pseudorhizobium endolithicum TaxID=1191678 RepID=A0ABM8PC81_9HYPH|nr:ABC transporter substrate-binding protein [Pseudorhizobium endolithicum]